MLNKWLFTRIDNSALVVFRMIFGFLIAIEAFGAIFTGWIRRTLIEPQETFTFIGFEFLQPLPGNGMLYYYAVMGVFGLLVMVGYKYRFSIIAYTVMWAGVYFMQKSSYNNHYYLLLLLCILMAIFPAHHNLSVDSVKNPEIRSSSMPRWVWVAIVLQLWIVYTYAAIAKIYPDWFNGSFPAVLMSGKRDFWLVGDLLQQQWVHYSIAWFGFLFDLLVIPLLLWRKTRLFAFCAGIFFHLFNSFIFHIGIFPYLALALMIFFFDSRTIHRIFLKDKKEYYSANEIGIPTYKKPLLIFFCGWFLLQIGLPMRHHFFEDDVLWTEEGHRLSWRMMLRSKSGRSVFKVVEKGSTDTVYVDKANYLTPKQMGSVNAKPDMIWQFAQRLKREYAAKGKDVQVFTDISVSVNGRPYRQFIDPKVDLANEKWQHFKHHDWILPSDLD